MPGSKEDFAGLIAGWLVRTAEQINSLEFPFNEEGPVVGIIIRDPHLLDPRTGTQFYGCLHLAVSEDQQAIWNLADSIERATAGP